MSSKLPRSDAHASPSSDRTFTPEERKRWQQKAADEELAMPANQARLKRMDDAINEETFSGELRRAIRDAKIPHQELANRIGVSWRQLLDFQAGDAALPSDAIDRLIEALAMTARLESDVTGR